MAICSWMTESKDCSGPREALAVSSSRSACCSGGRAACRAAERNCSWVSVASSVWGEQRQRLRKLHVAQRDRRRAVAGRGRVLRD